jgi:hypothetical protein
MAAPFGPLVMGSLVSGDAWTGTTTLTAPVDWTGTSNFSLANMPAGFQGMSGSSIQLAGHIQLLSYSNDTETLAIRIVDAALNALTSTLNYSNATANITTGVTFNETLTLTAAGIAGDATVWDGAQIEIVGTHTANMGKDGSTWYIGTLFNISGDFIGPPSVTMDTIDAYNMNSDLPDLLFTGHEGADPDLRFDIQISSTTQFDPAERLTATNISNVLYSGRELWQCFRSTGGRIREAVFEISKSASVEVGYLLAALYTSSGAYDNTASRRATFIRNSTWLAYADWPMAPGATGEITFNMGGDLGYLASPGEDLVIVLKSSGSISAATRGRGTTDFSDYEGMGGYLGLNSVQDLTQRPYFKIIEDGSIVTSANSFNNTDFSSVGGEPYAAEEQVTFTIPNLGDYTDAATYYWRVRVIDPNGTNIQSPWTTPRSFTYTLSTADILLVSNIVDSLAVADIAAYLVYGHLVTSNIQNSMVVPGINAFTSYETIILLAPADGAPAEPVPITLSWVAKAYTESYQIQIALDPDFNNIVIDEYTQFTTFQFTTAAPITEYFWRVRAVLQFK